MTLIPRESDAPCLETPLAALAQPITANEHFFVRNHFATPQISRNLWSLRVEGAVNHPRVWTFDALCNLPSVSRAITMECAGNSRQSLSPKVRGVSWASGAVGNAQWTGVPLMSLLDLAEVSPNAIEVILEGADSGAVPNLPAPIAFHRSLPLEKARRPEVLLAYQMNGQDLPTEHGAPLRAIVGGWYGMASVKWLTRIVVTDKPFDGHWQTTDYSYYERAGQAATLRPIQAMQVKSLIVRPEPGETIPLGSEYRIEGHAWAGEHAVANVQVSLDDGASWHLANLSEPSEAFAWARWEFAWRPTTRGPVRLMPRATDSAGRTQPMERDVDRRTYMVNHVVATEINVSDRIQ
ncbi:MAG: sulfite oxidase [Gemmataceae bacterium]